MNFENIIVNHENGLAQIIINRPSKLNALNKVTIKNFMMLLKILKKMKMFA